MKILLVGNPNVGKTTLFNALTNSHERTGNYHGVTVGVTERVSKFLGGATVADLPGLYSFGGMSMEETVAAEYIEKQTGEFLILQVIDAAHLTRSLELTKKLADRNLPIVIALTMCGKFRRQGGKIDPVALEKSLSIPCFEVDSMRKNSLKSLKNGLFIPKNTPKIGKIEGFLPRKQGEKPLEKLLLNPYFALPAFFLTAGLVFFLTFGKGLPGDFLKTIFERGIAAFASWVGEKISSPTIKSLVVDGFVGGAGSVLSFIPQIGLLYLFLDLLEESGAMSALAFTTDGLFSKIGLSGRAAFSVLLGYGCTAAAIASTRSLEDKEVQKRAVSCLYFLPCSAKLPVYLTLLSSLFKSPFWGAVVLYALGTGMGLAVAALKKQKDGVFLMEIAELCLPDGFFIVKKLLFQIKQFIIKISTTVLAFSIVVWFLSSFSFSGAVPMEESFLAAICGWLKYAFYPMGIYDWRAAFAAVAGLIAKENIAGTLGVLYPEGVAFSLPSAAAYLTFLCLIPPCVSAVAACKKELGGKTAWGYFGLQTLFAFTAAYSVRFLLSGGAGLLLCLLILFIIWKSHERIHCRKKRNFKRIYR